MAIMRKLEICALTVVCLLSLTTTGATAADCNTESDLGLTECVKFADYTDYQWSTCLTEDYIRRASAAIGKSYQCKDSSRTQCYYQCMLEAHDMEAGQVYPDCSCSSGETPIKTDILSPDCVSPSGLDCSWYESCLEKRYSCSGTEYDYAIRYALKFCNLYSETYSQFGSVARNWIDATRKCLQLKLVPLLRPWVPTTCKDLYNTAFKSHGGCYLAPKPGLSVCQLPCKDVWQIFWLLRKGGAFSTALSKTLEQFFQVAIGCFSQLTDITCLKENVQRLVSFGVRTPVGALSNLGGSLINYLAEKFSWKNRGLDWIPFSSDDPSPSSKRKRSVSETTEFNVQVLLVDTNSLNSIDSSTPAAGPSTLDNAVSEVEDSVEMGSLSKIPVTLNGATLSVGVSNFGSCRSLECNGTDLEISAKAPPSAAFSIHQPGIICVILLLALQL